MHTAVVPAHSSDALLVLHAVRLRGMSTPAAVATRFRLDPRSADELLLDFAASGWVSHSEFAGAGGWSLTAAGREENERQLRAELDDLGARSVVEDVYARFLPLNARFQSAVTRWQIRPLPGDELAANDHSDHAWDAPVLGTLAGLSRRLGPVEENLVAGLARFGGYTVRFAAALSRVDQGQPRWVDAPGIDSWADAEKASA